MRKEICEKIDSQLSRLEHILDQLKKKEYSFEEKSLIKGEAIMILKTLELLFQPDFTKFGVIQELEGHTETVNSVCYSPDGRYIVSGSGDRTVKIWDAKTGEYVKTLEGHEYRVDGVSYSPDGKSIVSGSWDKTIRIWDAKTGECLKTLEGHTHWVNSVSFSPNGKQIISGDESGKILIWGIPEEKES